jgi:pimeloyl-ACP methyl ester carboxylesterase
METKIQGSPRAETLTGTNVSLLAPGFTGRFVSVEPGAAMRGRRAADELPLAKALSLTSVSLVLSGVIELEPPAATKAAGVRGAAKSPPKVIVKALPKQEYAMLHTDEFGRKRWIFPEQNAAKRTTAEAVFVVPTEAPPVVPAVKGGKKGKAATRGVVTKTMRRLVSVVSWAVAPIVKKTAQAIAQAWEGEKRPYALWQVAAGGKLVAPNWSRFEGGGASLLVIHGTFSTPAAGFGSWFESDEFTTILKRYQGRVLALGHPSLSVAPEDNIDWLLDQLPGKAAWKGSFDVVCHSRGGLVARELAARAAAKQGPPVDRVCQVGTPNLGTLLADPTRWVDFLDTYTNCLTMLPDSTSTIVLEGLLCLVKIVGAGAADGLPGLVAMNPQGPWIKAIATRSSGAVRWYTIGTNYTPAQDVAAGIIGRVAGKVADAALDAFFKSDNDMVVPTPGCHEPGVAPTEQLSLDDAKTTHTSYFESVKVRQTLARWLD